MLMNFYCGGITTKEEMYKINEDNEYIYGYVMTKMVMTLNGNLIRKLVNV